MTFCVYLGLSPSTTRVAHIAGSQLWSPSARAERVLLSEVKVLRLIGAIHMGSRKAATNVRKHGVSFEEAETVFTDPLALAVEDAVDLGRTVLIGMSERLRVLLTVYTDVDDDMIRIISARRATSHERKEYEEGT